MMMIQMMTFKMTIGNVDYLYDDVVDSYDDDGDVHDEDDDPTDDNQDDNR
jgi:hypothetical protein